MQVFHFPKRERAPSRTLEDGLRVDERGQSLTLPEFRADEGAPAQGGPITEPNFVALAGDARATPPWPERSVPEKAKDKRRRVPARRRNTPVERQASTTRKSAGTAGAAGKSAGHAAERSLIGHQLFEMGRLEEARVVFEGLVESDPGDAFPHTMLGTIYLAQGVQDRALALFEAALQIDPEELAALVYRGEIRLSQGKVKAALADLNRATALGLGDDPFVDRARRLIRMSQDRARQRP